MSYTKASLANYKEALEEVRDTLNDAIDSVDEYIGAMDDSEADDDAIGIALQELEDLIDTVKQNGVQLDSILEEGN